MNHFELSVVRNMQDELDNTIYGIIHDLEDQLDDEEYSKFRQRLWEVQDNIETMRKFAEGC